MTQISVTTRGNEVVWECTFSVSSDPLAEPTSAILRVVYPLNNADAEVLPTLTKGGDGVWRGYWDSRNADAGGRVFWWVRCDGDVIAATEGSFKLEANPANYEI